MTIEPTKVSFKSQTNVVPTKRRECFIRMDCINQKSVSGIQMCRYISALEIDRGWIQTCNIMILNQTLKKNLKNMPVMRPMP